jgi:hypothetical protein
MSNWWPENNLVGTCIATAALVLSVVNFVRTSRVSDRQYALSFSEDIRKWASDVILELSKAIEATSLDYKDSVDLVSLRKCFWTFRRLYHFGVMLLTTPKFIGSDLGFNAHHLLKKVDDMAQKCTEIKIWIENEQLSLADDQTGFFSVSQASFAEDVEKFLKSERRYAAATAALSN